MEEEIHLLSPDGLTDSSLSPSSGRQSDSIQVQDFLNIQPREEKKKCKSGTKALTAPVGIVRILEVIFTCISFSLVASLDHSTFYLRTLCMFTWCFCFCVTLLILLLEFTSLSTKLSISWDDFTIAFAMLAAIMVLTASIIYQSFFNYIKNSKGIVAMVTSYLAFNLYANEVSLTCIKSGETSGFPSTVPGLLKVLETFWACLIFICLDDRHLSELPGLQWCVAVYSICFIFGIVVIVSTICHIQTLFPALFYKVLTVCNVLAVLMYITAVVIWPLYSFQNEPWTSYCRTGNYFEVVCINLVAISFMTCVNLVFYIVDTLYSFRLVHLSLGSTKSSGNL